MLNNVRILINIAMIFIAFIVLIKAANFIQYVKENGFRRYKQEFELKDPTFVNQAAVYGYLCTILKWCVYLAIACVWWNLYY